MPETIDENTAIQTITVTVGRSGVSLAGLYDEMLTAYNNNVFTVSYDTAGQDPKDVDLDALWAKHCTAPVDAAEGSNGTITPARYGYGFDLDDAKAALSAAGEGDMLTLTLKPIAPSVTAEELENQLFRDVLASCETPYDADETGRTTNLELACKAIDGLVLQPGDVFSYNDTLGERTEEKGYQLGPSYVNGEVVQEIGGGICQVSSTLYNCVLTADLEVLERENHMFYPGYVDPGLDCAVNWGTLDFRFRNSSGHAIRIEASLNGYNVTIKLLSTDDKDYYVKMEYDILRTYDFNTYYRDLDEDNAEGYRNGDTIVDGVEGYYMWRLTAAATTKKPTLCGHGSMRPPPCTMPGMRSSPASPLRRPPSRPISSLAAVYMRTPAAKKRTPSRNRFPIGGVLLQGAINLPVKRCRDGEIPKSAQISYTEPTRRKPLLWGWNARDGANHRPLPPPIRLPPEGTSPRRNSITYDTCSRLG